MNVCPTGRSGSDLVPEPQDPGRSMDVLVIGAGPAGLALGFELKRRGLRFLILEKGAAVADSWRRMPNRLKLVSPWKTNFLPGSDKHFWPRHHQNSREEFLLYLQEYAREHTLPVRAKVDVQAVEQKTEAEELFRVQTSEGIYHSRAVVNATGYFSNPFLPEIPGAPESGLPQLHVAEYQDPQTVRKRSGLSRGLVLIIGQRLSAGQTMVELIDGGFEVAISHRSPIRFGTGPLGWWILFRIFPWLEWIKLKRLGAKAPGNDVRMQGGRARKLIQSRRVKTFPAVRRFEKRRVLFEDGSELRPDLVIYATGFRPALQHLAPLALRLDPQTGLPALRDLESVTVPGLYFLGIDGGRNFQSRFIRGIRQDVVFLARRLEEQLCLDPVNENKTYGDPRAVQTA